MGNSSVLRILFNTGFISKSLSFFQNLGSLSMIKTIKCKSSKWSKTERADINMVGEND